MVIEINRTHADLPFASCIFYIDLGADPDEVWKKLSGAVADVIKFPCNSWPDDDFWRETLPKWLVDSMLTLEESRDLLQRTPRENWDEIGWEFSSWLEAIKDREWEWWADVKEGRFAKIILKMTNIPPRIYAFKQILVAAGVTIDQEIYDPEP